MKICIELDPLSPISVVLRRMSRYYGQRIEEIVKELILMSLVDICINDPEARNDFCTELRVVLVGGN